MDPSSVYPTHYRVTEAYLPLRSVAKECRIRKRPFVGIQMSGPVFKNQITSPSASSAGPWVYDKCPRFEQLPNMAIRFRKWQPQKGSGETDRVRKSGTMWVRLQCHISLRPRVQSEPPCVDDSQCETQLSAWHFLLIGLPMAPFWGKGHFLTRVKVFTLPDINGSLISGGPGEGLNRLSRRNWDFPYRLQALCEWDYTGSEA